MRNNSSSLLSLTVDKRSMTHIEQEKRTVRQMVEIYCYGKKHTAKGLCEECSALLDYAYQRLAPITTWAI